MKMSELKSMSEQSKENRRMRISQIEKSLNSGLIKNNPKGRLIDTTITQMKKDEPEIAIPYWKRMEMQRELNILKSRI